MPDNELDELADNFFCHLHDHGHYCESSHNEASKPNAADSTSEDLTNLLNPLRDTSKLRKSILANSTVFMLNNNHLDPMSIQNEDNSVIKCSVCKFNIGYKGITF
jgi:hypothetical protein